MAGTGRQWITDEGKRYRVACWLEDLARCQARLQEVECKLSEIDMMGDGIGTMRYDRPYKPTFAHADRVGTLLVNREEARMRLSDEADELRLVLANGTRLLSTAWRANDGAADGCFAYVLARYGRGMMHDEAAAAAHLGRWEAKGAVRKIASMIYDHTPEAFEGPYGELSWTQYYGYDAGHLPFEQRDHGDSPAPEKPAPREQDSLRPPTFRS